MGDRASISFTNKSESSVVLFSHWGRREFQEEALKFARRMAVRSIKNGEGKPSQISPLDRLEPGTMMMEFIRQLTAGMTEVGGDFYLGRDENDGDNSDNGHVCIDVDEVMAEMVELTKKEA